jgi:zinc/manganese transport system substrate-binding protein
MNETEPTVTQIKDFEEKLQQHRVRLLIYNDQVSNPSTQRMQKLAERYGIPTIGVTETQPADKSYLDWMMSELTRVQRALEGNYDSN